VFEVAFSVVFYLLIQAIGAMLTVLVIATSPIFSILGGVVLFKERLGARLVVAAAITLAGVFLVTIARL
jgi:drug/metabolite transporter (DMT)-like permease